MKEKWWHVPDEQIEDLVRNGLQQASLHAGACGSTGTTSQRRPSSLPLQRGKLGDDAKQVITKPDTRAVRFGACADVDDGDAIDNLLRHTRREVESPNDFEAQPGGTASASRKDRTRHVDGGPKSWKVSDDQIRHYILEMSNADCSNEAAVQASAHSVLANSRRCRGPPAGDGKICVNIFMVDSGDTLLLRVPSDLRIGPSRPPPPNRFTDIFGQGASTKGFAQRDKSFDYKRRELGSTQRPGWTPEWIPSLKGLVEHLTGLEVDRQILSYKNMTMAQDDLTLAARGIKGGETLQLRAQQKRHATGGKGREVALATTKRREEVLKRQRHQQASSNEGSAVASLRQSRHLSKCRSDGDVWMMPRWIHNDSPELFSRVGAGVDGHGGHTVRPDFESTPIFLSDATDCSMARVREVVCGHKLYVPTGR